MIALAWLGIKIIVSLYIVGAIILAALWGIGVPIAKTIGWLRFGSSEPPVTRSIFCLGCDQYHRIGEYCESKHSLVKAEANP